MTIFTRTKAVNMKKRVLIFILLSAFSIVLPSCLSRNKKAAGNAESREAAATIPADDITLVKGRLVIGHEVRVFSASDDKTEYWIVDKSGELRKEYERTVGPDAKPYTPVYAELKIKDLGKSGDGFAADYAGVYEVVEIIKVTAWRE